MISSKKTIPTFPQKTSWCNVSALVNWFVASVSLWPRSIRTSAELRIFATRDVQTNALFFSGSHGVRPYRAQRVEKPSTIQTTWRHVKSVIVNSTFPVSTSLQETLTWLGPNCPNLTLLRLNRFRPCWTLLYLQRWSSSSHFCQGLCLGQIRMRVMDPLRAGPQFGKRKRVVQSFEALAFSKSPKFRKPTLLENAELPWIVARPPEKRRIPSHRFGHFWVGTVKLKHHGTMRFLQIFRDQIRTRRASTILRPDLNFDPWQLWGWCRNSWNNLERWV